MSIYRANGVQSLAVIEEINRDHVCCAIRKMERLVWQKRAYHKAVTSKSRQRRSKQALLSLLPVRS